MKRRRRRPPAGPAPGPLAVLDADDLAKWLRLSVRTIERLQPPRLPLPGRHYLVRDVLAWLDARREGKVA